MTDLPIPMSAPMVHAILREIEAPGTGKTQTRRVIEPVCHDPTLRPGMAGYKPSPIGLWQIKSGGPYFLPRYLPGDRLYVREHWRTEAVWDDTPPRDIEHDACNVFYEADGKWSDRDQMNRTGRFRQGMHMPRWASRLTLIVTEVRVERLHDCSRADAIAEGVQMETADPPFYYVPDLDTALTAVGIEEPGGNHPQRSYAKLWNHIHGPGAWVLNPWVAAYTFRPILGNIDSAAARAALGDGQ